MATDDVQDGIHQPHYRTLDDTRLSAEEMDEKRKQNIAYEYLCHLEEARVWVEACIKDELPPTIELEEGLRNGVFLAKLGHFFAPQVAPIKRIYDKEQTRYKATGLHFRHTDNVNHWFAAMEDVGLPKIFYPETTDIYDRKNMPRAIYCVHALSLYLFKLGLAPQIQDLYGKIKFTDEEISAMRSALDKYGIQMPSFSKIGGLLANELSVDDAALHAAIIAINDAVEKRVDSETMSALQNPAAMLTNLNNESEVDYQNVLYQAKHIKAENARNKSIDLDNTYEVDAYDELLTQAEIQGNLNKVNTCFALDKINEALLKADKTLLLEALRSPFLGLKNIDDKNVDFYVTELRQAREVKKNNNSDDVALDKEEIQQAIATANLHASAEFQKMQAVQTINAAIDSQDPAQLLRALQAPTAQLPEVLDFAGGLYMEEFNSVKADKEADLDYDEIFAAVKVLSAIAQINKAVDTGDPGSTYNALEHQDACIPNLEEQNSSKYHDELANEKAKKDGLPNELLVHHEICAAADAVNLQVQEEHERILAVGIINEAIDEGDPMETLACLMMPTARIMEIDQRQAIHYQDLLARMKQKKAANSIDDSDILWLEEIQSTIRRANQDADDALKMSIGVATINHAVDNEDLDMLLNGLSNRDVYLHSVTPNCIPKYMDLLQNAKAQKQDGGDCDGHWIVNKLKDGSDFYFNTESIEFSWSPPENAAINTAYLNRQEIQKVLTAVTADYDRQMLFKANERFIILVQARCRGYLIRKAFIERKTFMCTQLPAIIKLQSCLRGANQRKKYKDRLEVLHSNVDAVIKIQSMIRMWRDRRKFKQRKKYFNDNTKSIIKIQAFFRSNMARNEYKALMHDENPSVSVVRKFVHLLDASDADYAEELELQKLRQHVVTEIRSNHQLEHDLDQMDIKIGLLIKNRITLQDVVTHNRKLNKNTENSRSTQKGLKALSKESRERLDAYQHLFYLLQTNPTYLAKLIFEMPQKKTTKFMESVIYSLFNYGSNQREEYLLLKLFKTALEEEIISKVDKMTDIVTGNPLVIKMIVGFNRSQRGQNSLRDMLNPLIREVLDDKDLSINTNPTEVYKQWVNSTETQTGRASGLPYDVTVEQALQHEEVVTLLNQSVEKLQNMTEKFLITIIQSLKKIPYGIRYMAKVLKAALWQKFPLAPEKDVLKIVGNLLYYRYINSAIVAPDAFDIVDVQVSKALSSDQRRNLGSIAKLLQFAAANKGFGGDNTHLVCLNNYVRDSHEKFRSYFREACNVDEPEVMFNIDQYTDVTMISKPIIYISIQELCDTHQLLIEHQDIIAPDHSDPLHEILEDLGDCPDIDSVIGSDGTNDDNLNEEAHSQLAATEISLTLMNKFELPEDDQSDMKALWIRTKRMVVDILACQTGDTLTQILDLPASDEQEEHHQNLIKQRDQREKKATQAQNKLSRQPSMLGDNRLPLDSMKTKIKKNLQSLELGELVTRKNHYQSIVNAIAQDIRNQRRYRHSRKQELIKVRSTLKGLHDKRSFYEEQIDYYNQYVKMCLQNLQQKGTKKPKSFSLFRRHGNSAQSAKGSIKYSAAKLHEKGVILEIEGLPPNQFKNVLFEISATEVTGAFEVNAKFMGVQMDKVDMIFQDLLQLQYEGVAVMKMFDKAKVNVNLLIFLLNRKFYGK